MSYLQVDEAVIRAQARTVIESEGFSAFRPTSPSYNCKEAKGICIIPITTIKPPSRDKGVDLLPRAKPILIGIQSGEALPPIIVQLLSEIEPYRFQVTDGFHRFHLSRGLGFTHIPAIVDPT